MSTRPSVRRLLLALRSDLVDQHVELAEHLLIPDGPKVVVAGAVDRDLSHWPAGSLGQFAAHRKWYQCVLAAMGQDGGAFDAGNFLDAHEVVLDQQLDRQVR